MNVNPTGLVAGTLQPGTMSVPDGRDARAWRQAKLFEAQFLSIMLKQGQQARQPWSGAGFGSGFAGEVWQGMRTKATAAAIARKQDLGIAKQVYRSVERGLGG